MEETIVLQDIADQQVTDGSQTANIEEQTHNADNEVVANHIDSDVYQKVTNEAKGYRQRLAKANKELEGLKQGKLQEQGKFKELADQWKDKYETTQKELDDTKQAFVYTTVKSQVARMANKMGCQDSDTLTDLIAVDEIPVDDKFNVDKDSVKLMLENLRKTKPYFFGKVAPLIKDALPGKVEKKTRNLSDVPIMERAAMLSKLGLDNK